MSRIDLHIHSNFSDGTKTPKEIIDIAIENKLSAIALTDHDTIAGTYEFMSYNPSDKLAKIPGVEISSELFDTEVHILGFWIHKKREIIEKFLKNILFARNSRNREMLCRLKKYYNFDISEEELKCNNDNRIIGRMNMASLLTEKGYFKSPQEAFRECLMTDGKIYIPRKLPSAEDVIKIIHDSGGIAMWAHPSICELDAKCRKASIIKFLKQLIEFNIDGVEAYYSNCHRAINKLLLQLKNQYKLQVTGGSDFHGENQPNISMGYGKNNSMFVPETIYYELLKYINNRNII